MSVILQVNYRWTDDAVAEAIAATAKPDNEIPGLQWKLWIRDFESKTGGGIHLFVDRKSARSYLDNTIEPALTQREGLHEIEAKVLDLNEVASRANRAPLDIPPLVTLDA